VKIKAEEKNGKMFSICFKEEYIFIVNCEGCLACTASWFTVT
jgi:hypothetical protein